MSRLALMAVLAAGVIGLAGCGSGDEEEAAPEDDVAEDTADDPAAEEGEDDAAADTEADAAGGAIPVSAVEMAFEGLPESVPAGTVEFELTNDGSMPHDITIEGVNGDQPLASVEAGESATGSAELEPGEYTVYCSVGNHRASGMEATLVVE